MFCKNTRMNLFSQSVSEISVESPEIVFNDEVIENNLHPFRLSRKREDSTRADFSFSISATYFSKTFTLGVP